MWSLIGYFVSPEIFDQFRDVGEIASTWTQGTWRIETGIHRVSLIPASLKFENHFPALLSHGPKNVIFMRGQNMQMGERVFW
jgi:hypothetical protein